jgi:hypothetical protein
MTKIESYFLALLKVGGFIERFHTVLQYCETHEEAYDLVEKQHEDTFGFKKYADFESFRSSMSQYYKRKREKNGG